MRILIYVLSKIQKTNLHKTPDHENLSFIIWSSNFISFFRLLMLPFITYLMLNCWIWICPNGINPIFMWLAEIVNIWLFTRIKEKIQRCLKERGWSLWWQQNPFWFMFCNPGNLAEYPPSSALGDHEQNPSIMGIPTIYYVYIPVRLLNDK